MTPIDISDFSHRSSAELRDVIDRAVQVLAERAGGDGAAPTAGGRRDPTMPVDPPKPVPVDLNEKLSDGNLRYLRRKEAAAALRCGVDKIKSLIDEYDAGVQVGGTWYLDRTKLPFLRED